MRFDPGWQERLGSALAELPARWLQLYSSAREFAAGESVSKHVPRLSVACQTTAILCPAAGLEAALECLRASRMEIDCWMGKYLHP
jgi:hypothetical protein